MENRLPFYMVYPMPLQFDDDRIERRDVEYMKSLYPDTVKWLLPYIEDECDRMEYEGSMIFDEYPDRLQLQLLCSRIYDRIRNSGEIERMRELDEEDMDMNQNTDMEMNRNMEEEMRTQQMRRRNRGRDDRLRDLVEVLVFQELLNRRSRRRRQQRRFY